MVFLVVLFVHKEDTEGLMIAKKIDWYLFSLTFVTMSVYFSSHGASWVKDDEVCKQVNDALMGEDINIEKGISADQNNNLWALSKTADGRRFLSVNGRKIWDNAKAKPGEPTDLKSISVSSVKNWTAEITSEKNDLRLTSCDGTIWATTYNKGLFKFIKGTDGTYTWQNTGKANVMDIASGVDGETWILCDEKQDWPGVGWQVYRLNENGTWEKKGGNQIFCLAVANKSTVYGITNPRQIYGWNTSKNNWDWKMNAAECKMIAAAPSGLWDVIHVGWTYKWVGNNWSAMGGNNIRQVTAGNKRVYAMTNVLYDRAAIKGVFQLAPLANISEVYVLYE